MKLKKTIENSSNEFAGTYFQGGFSGYFLRWSSEGGFYFHQVFSMMNILVILGRKRF